MNLLCRFALIVLLAGISRPAAADTPELRPRGQAGRCTALTDSGNASASGMANPTGANAKAGQAVRQLVDAPPKAGTNTILVTHKTNIADAFGKEAGDVQEGEAFVYKTSGSGPAIFAGRIKLAGWKAKAGR